MTPLTLEQIEKAVVKIADILLVAYDPHTSRCGGDFAGDMCSNCSDFAACQRSSRLEIMAYELMEIIEEETQ